MSRALVVLGVMFVALLAALPASAQPAAAPVSINIGDDWFCAPTFEKSVCPTTLTAGDTVVWTLTEGNHTVTECDANFSNCSGGFNSGPLASSETFEQTVASGTIYYRCDVHPTKMRGRLDVSAAPALTPAPTPTPTPAPTPTPPPPPPPSGGEPPSGGGAPTSGGTSSGGTTTAEQPPPTAQPSGADPSPTPSPGARTAAVAQATPRSNLPDPETRSSATTPVVLGTAQTPIDDSGGGSSLWLYALIAIAGVIALLGSGAFAFRRYRHRLFRHD